MKIRVCSDLHIDVNKTTDFGFLNKMDEVDLTVIAGDIAGDYQMETKFLNDIKCEKPVVCVAGNHLGYNYDCRPERLLKPYDGTKLFSINKLCQSFNGPINYLENHKILVNGKIVFAGTMYTDFNLYYKPEICKELAKSSMNDFRYVKVYDNSGVRNITPEDYQDYFNVFMYELKKTLEETKEDSLDVIVVTHFAPSNKSISAKYLGNNRYLNPAYASDLSDFIKKNPRIKLWCHGHMHDSFYYQIGKCTVVCQPFGYIWEAKVEPKDYNGLVVEI